MWLIQHNTWTLPATSPIKSYFKVSEWFSLPCEINQMKLGSSDGSRSRITCRDVDSKNAVWSSGCLIHGCLWVKPLPYYSWLRQFSIWLSVVNNCATTEQFCTLSLTSAIILFVSPRNKRLSAEKIWRYKDNYQWMLWLVTIGQDQFSACFY